MASTRKMKRKRLRLHGTAPGSADHVDIPVIEEISFRDPKTNQQEYGFRFKNNENDTREVRVQKVKAASGSFGGSIFQNPVLYMDVERIKSISFKDPKTNMQEYGYRLRNPDPPPLTPDGDDGGNLRHRKVQYVRYTKDNTPTGIPWVDVEQYVEFEVKDPKTNMQEFVYRLNWGDFNSLPKITDNNDPYATNPNFDLRLGNCDTGLELYPENAEAPGGIDPPYRLDPFQNIVNVSGPQGLTIVWQIEFGYTLTIPGDCHDASVDYTSNPNLEVGYVHSTTAGFTPGHIAVPSDSAAIVSNGASLSGDLFQEYDDWTIGIRTFFPTPGFVIYPGPSSHEYKIYSSSTIDPDTVACSNFGGGVIGPDGVLSALGTLHATGNPAAPGFQIASATFNIGSTTAVYLGQDWIVDFIASASTGGSNGEIVVVAYMKPAP